jgi:hypothetical protein
VRRRAGEIRLELALRRSQPPFRGAASILEIVEDDPCQCAGPFCRLPRKSERKRAGRIERDKFGEEVRPLARKLAAKLPSGCNDAPVEIRDPAGQDPNAIILLRPRR